MQPFQRIFPIKISTRVESIGDNLKAGVYFVIVTGRLYKVVNNVER
ncbi:MAG TPA: hypothetical protein PKU67_06160 [Candidatus Hydrothermia bacterium]|nr:hypothetical protein [Candidatus Hydrothermia bacterium]